MRSEHVGTIILLIMLIIVSMGFFKAIVMGSILYTIAYGIIGLGITYVLTEKD